MNLTLRKIVGFIAQAFVINCSFCHRCGRPWAICKEHITLFTNTLGGFPLCEACWQELTPEERLPYYEQLFNEWYNSEKLDVTWNQIKDAVLGEGKEVVTNGREKEVEGNKARQG